MESNWLLAVIPLYALYESVRSIHVDLRDTRMHAHAVDTKSARHIRAIALALVFVASGIAGLEAWRGDVPLWAFFLPALGAYVGIATIAGLVAHRPKMNRKRFGEMVVAPMLSAFTPLYEVALARLPTWVKYLA